MRKSRIRVGTDGVEAKGGDISPRGLSQAESIAESKHYYDPNLIAEWKKSCLANNAMEAAHDADFMSTLRARMKKSVSAALDSKN